MVPTADWLNGRLENMHSTRWITGLIAAPLLILLIVAGGRTLFTLFVATAAMAAVWEYNRIFFYTNSEKKPVQYFLPEYFFSALIVLVAGTGAPEWVLFAVFAALVGLGFFSLWRFKDETQVGKMVAGQIQGIVYIAVPLALIVLIRTGNAGRFWILALLVTIFAGDTAAYYCGTHLGKRKLCPWVSPKKTVEGALGGLAANFIVGFILKLFFLPQVGWMSVLAMCVLLGAVGQVGDLFESVLKRTADIKDSGNILPGHGGILDRIDALLFAAPVAWIFITKVL